MTLKVARWDSPGVTTTGIDGWPAVWLERNGDGFFQPDDGYNGGSSNTMRLICAATRLAISLPNKIATTSS